MTTKFVDLSQKIWHGSIMWPQLAPAVQIPAGAFGGIRSTGWRDKNHPGWYDMGGPWPLAGGGFGWNGHLHPGTHVDAPKYCIPDGITADQIPLENLFGTGVVLDFRNKGKWDRITTEDFEKAKPKIEAGDFVVCNTGWQKHLSPTKQYEYWHNYPGLVPSAAEWLIKKKVKAIAGTWPTCDHCLAFAPLEKYIPSLRYEYMKETGKDPGEEFPDFEPCLTMLLKNGITCIQNAGGDIDQVTGQRCMFAAFPMRMDETDGCMVRLVAIIEK
jgi:kynurenine formamidase